jgi:succinate dehydrogenase/fumarate reductase cytochrome b subunit
MVPDVSTVPHVSLTPPSARAPSGRAWIVVAALAALAYPGLLWCGVRLSPAFVVLALAVPLLGVAAAGAPASQHARTGSAIAHLVVAAPPLFSVLGGWLDFQRAVPIGSLGVWLALWSTLVVVAARSRAHPAAATAPAPHHLAIAHGISAAVIMLFALPHLLNHLAGVLGGDAHIAMMTALRRVYRHRLVEPVLLAAVVFQVGSGVWLLWRKLARARDWLDTLQTLSGAYLLMFLLSHVSAALRARLLRGVDPNWAWLSGGELLTDPWSVRLAPYYFLGVIALGLHAACGLCAALRGHRVAIRSTVIVAALGGLAAAVSALIMLGLFRA